MRQRPLNVPGVRWAAAALLAAGLVTAGGSSADAALPANCKFDADGSGWICVTVTSDKANSTFKVVWSGEMINDTPRAQGLTCSASTSKTFTYGATATISASAGVIFAKVDSQVSADLSKSTTSGFETSATITVPAHSTTQCDYGVSTHAYKGTVTHTRCSSSKCVKKSGTFSLHAPSVKAAWHIYDQ